MSSENPQTIWRELEISTYQHHVIVHVLGATVLGWVAIEDALHILLDVGLLWTIYINAEMSLMAQGVAIEDLESEELNHDEVIQLTADAQLLISEGREAAGLQRFTGAPVECIIVSVEVFESDARRRVVIAGETADIEVETSLEPAQFNIEALPHSLSV